MLKWASLGLLIMQNSGVFVLTRYTRLQKGRLYLASVVVMAMECIKFVICLLLILRQADYSFKACAENLVHGIWHERQTTLLLGVPALCYAVQNNLIFVAIGNLSAAAAQVIYQGKTLSTALFTVIILGRRFRVGQWASFGMLMLGVVLVQSQDAKSATAPTGAYPLLGVAAAATAACLSGFAGVYLEKMFTSGGTSLWLRNVQLGLFTVPLQAAAVYQLDGAAVRHHGLFQGFRLTTWALVALQVAGALLIAVVIKHAGNVLKTFATSIALLVTCACSTVLFDFQPTPLFVVGVGLTASSIWLYSRPDDPALALSLVCKRVEAARGWAGRQRVGEPVGDSTSASGGGVRP